MGTPIILHRFEVMAGLSLEWAANAWDRGESRERQRFRWWLLFVLFDPPKGLMAIEYCFGPVIRLLMIDQFFLTADLGVSQCFPILPKASESGILNNCVISFAMSRQNSFASSSIANRNLRSFVAFGPLMMRYPIDGHLNSLPKIITKLPGCRNYGSKSSCV